MSHTPGPWRWTLLGSEGYAIYPDCDDKRERVRSLARVCGRDPLTDEGNARLIAAADDLLKACEAVLSDDQATASLGTVRMLEAAIAKARGE